MKVYSWVTLLVTILLGGGMIIWKFGDMMAGDASAFIFIAFLVYLIIQGLLISFTKEGFEKDKRKVARGKRIYRKLFGPWAIAAPWGHLILILLAAVSIRILPSQKWLSIILLIGGLIYAIVCGSLVRKHMKIEEEISKENHEESDTR